MEPEKCSCGGVLETSSARLADYEVDARRCDSCGDIELNPEQMQLVLGHRKLTDQGTIETSVRGPSGNGKSAYLRLPPDVYQEMRVSPEDDHHIQAIQPGWLAVCLNSEAENIQPADVGQVGEGTTLKKEQTAAEGEQGQPQGDGQAGAERPQQPSDAH